MGTSEGAYTYRGGDAWTRGSGGTVYASGWAGSACISRSGGSLRAGGSGGELDRERELSPGRSTSPRESGLAPCTGLAPGTIVAVEYECAWLVCGNCWCGDRGGVGACIAGPSTSYGLRGDCDNGLPGLPLRVWLIRCSLAVAGDAGDDGEGDLEGGDDDATAADADAARFARYCCCR